MEVTPCVQEAGSHAASLLMGLNLQREQAQFCDCVVRQSQNPGQLYPAHRCVLAASSPVLASLLSSAGVLVELHAPCLSDSVLEFLLDYMYTGILPDTCSQQQYYSLLTAACQLQMDELQEALKAGMDTADDTDTSSGAETQSYKETNNTDTCSVNSQRAGDEYCSSSTENDPNHSRGSNISPLSNLNTGYSVADSTGCSVNISTTCRQVAHLTPQDLMQNIACTAEEHRVSGLNKEERKDLFHSAGAVKPESWQKSTELTGTVEDTRNLYLLCTAEVQLEETSRAEKTQQLRLTTGSKAEERQPNRNEEIHDSPLFRLSPLKDNVSPSECSSSSSPHPSCGAVPVICHSSRAVMVSPMPPYRSESRAAVSTPDSRSGTADSNRTVEVITTKLKMHHVAQNQDHGHSTDHIVAQNGDYVNSDQCATRDLCHKSSADQSEIQTQDYRRRKADRGEHTSNVFSHIVGLSDRHVHADSSQNMNPAKPDSVPQNMESSRGFKYKTDPAFDCFPSKHQRLDCSDCRDISNYLRAGASLPAPDSVTGSDCHCYDLCPEEHSYSSRCAPEMDRQDGSCSLNDPKTDWYLNLQGAETNAEDAASSRHEQFNKDTAIENVTDGLSTIDRRTSVEHDTISGAEILAPHLTFTMPLDNNPVYSNVGPTYRGHLRYHCLAEEGLKDSNHKFSHPDHSDQSSDEEEVGTSPGLSPLRQHFATTDQVLLLDISSKPAELLVSYKRASEKGQKWVAVGHKDTLGSVSGNGDKEQHDKATSVAGLDNSEVRPWTKLGAESFDGAESWTGETNDEEGKPVGKDRNRQGAEVIWQSGGMAGESQTTTVTVCSPPCVPDPVQASVPSTLSVCMPPALSANVPTNISAHLSTPVLHPFQCSLCERSFSQRGSLNRHVRSHLGVRPFPCPRCPMTFSRQYRVTEHMRVHQRCVLRSDFQKPPASSI